MRDLNKYPELKWYKDGDRHLIAEANTFTYDIHRFDDPAYELSIYSVDFIISKVFGHDYLDESNKSRSKNGQYLLKIAQRHADDHNYRVMKAIDRAIEFHQTNKRKEVERKKTEPNFARDGYPSWHPLSGKSFS